jgi:drug/metabolite transporter (DMT)-like permease
MILGCACFACMATLAHAAGNTLPWQTVAIGRSLVPLVLVAVWALATGVQLVFFRPPILWMRSIAGSVSLVCTFFALTRMPPPEVFSITSMYPVWVAVLSWPMLGEPPAPSVWLSIACSLCGVWLIYPLDFLTHVPTTEDLPILAVIVASFATSLAMIGLHRLQGIDTKAVVVHFSFTSLVFAVSAWLFLPHRVVTTAPTTEWPIVAVLGLGVAATFGQIFLTKAFTHGDPAKVSVVNLMQIPFTLILDLLFFDHGLQWQKLAGMCLILGPTAWLLASQKAKKLPLDQEPPDA